MTCDQVGQVRLPGHLKSVQLTENDLWIYRIYRYEFRQVVVGCPVLPNSWRERPRNAKSDVIRAGSAVEGGNTYSGRSPILLGGTGRTPEACGCGQRVRARYCRRWCVSRTLISPNPESLVATRPRPIHIAPE